MDIQKLIGLRVTHVTWGPGSITKADDKYVWVEFDEGSLKKYQYPKAFAAFLTIDDPLLQKEILDEEKNLAEKAKVLSSAKQVSYERKLPRSSRSTGAVQDSRGNLFKEKPFNDHILEFGNSFSTHAEALNTCFGFKYKQYQKAYKDLGGGYAVWFPSIARKTLGEYVSTDSFSGWVNILSEDQKILLQVDNPIYSISDKSYDPNKRIIFARFEGDKRYRFIGIYGSEKRVKNGYEYTRLGTTFDTISFQIIEE